MNFSIRNSTFSNKLYIVNNSWDLMNGKEIEYDLIEWSKQFVKRDECFVDVGAHMGTYTFNLINDCSHVYAFEPQLTTFCQLCGGIYMNNLHSKISAYNVALSDTSDERGTLYINSNDGGTTSLYQQPNCFSKQIVKIMKLDDFIFAQKIGFIKMDCENSELQVIKGGINTIKKHNPFIMFECNNDNRRDLDQIKNLLSELGYTTVSINNYPHMFLSSPFFE
jgi:FkbM family methyltransferase